MQRTLLDSRSIVLAVSAGLALAAESCKGSGSSSDPGSTGVTVASATKGDKACCKGLNDCKGKGGCAVDGKHDCAGKNDCKGQGGCNMHCPK